MKLNRILFIALCILSVLTLNAQNIKVTGIVLADDETPIEYANVILTSNNTDKINGTITTTNGSFELKAAQNKYKLTVSILGYETYTSEIIIDKDINLGNIKLKAGAQQLNEAVVTAKLIDRKADRFIMNVQANPATMGKNTVELLAMAPSVWVDKQKGISINGKTDIKVMINDRIISMSTDELLNYLETIKSEDIQSIEIITDPGAEYEANSNSGILHIKLKKGFQGGLTGSVTMGYRLNRGKSGYMPSMNFNYKRDKLSLSGSLSHYNGKWSGNGTTNAKYLDKNIEVQQLSETESNNRNLRANLNTVYELTDKHEIGFTFEGRNTNSSIYNRTSSEVFENNLLTKKTRSSNDNEWKFNRYDASANYKFKIDTLGSYLKAYVDCTNHDAKDNFLWNLYKDDNTIIDSTYKQYRPANYEIYAFRADYKKAFNANTSVSFGGRYGYAKMLYKSRFESLKNNVWKEVENLSDDYKYNEHVGALYAKFDSKWGDLSYTLGVRYENTSLNIAEEFKPSYNDFFPSIFGKYTLNEKKGHSVNASYNRKLQRPYYTNFNPFKEWNDEYSYSCGNPYLKPTYVDSYSTGVTFFDKYIFTFNYNVYNDAIDRITAPAPEPNTSMTTPINFDKIKSLYISLYVPVKVTSWYNFTASIAGSNRKHQSQVANNQSWVCYANTQHTINLPKNWTISLSAWYTGKQTYGNMDIGDMGGFDGSISKQFWKKKLVATFNWWNIQGLRYINLWNKTDKFTQVNRVLNQNQIFNFTLTYNFSVGKKVDVKKAEKGTEDERL